MPSVQVSYLRLAELVLAERSVPITVAFSTVTAVQVSWLQLGVTTAPITGSGTAEGQPGQGTGNGNVIGPFVVQPPVGGGIIISRPAVVEPPPARLPPVRAIRGKAKVVGFVGQAKARGYVLSLIFATGGTFASRGQVSGRGTVQLPVLQLQLAIKAHRVRGRGRGRVVLPRCGRARITSPGRWGQSTGRVLDPAIGRVGANAVRVTAQAQGRVMRLLAWELEDLWLVGMGVDETDEALVLR